MSRAVSGATRHTKKKRRMNTKVLVNISQGVTVEMKPENNGVSQA